MRNEFSDLVVDNMKKSRKMEKNKLKVDNVKSFKRRNYVVQESDAGPSESEASGDRMSRYSSKSSVKSSIEDELPELIVFLQETNYEFVKDICIDEAVTSREKCFEESCHIENDHAPCLFKYNAGETDAESTEESEDSESIISSTESTQTLENDFFNKVNVKQKVHSDAIDEIPSDVPAKKSVPKLFLDRRVTGKKAASSTNSIALSLNKILDENKNKGKAVARINIEHGSIFHNSGLSQSTIQGGSSNWTAGCGHCRDCTMGEDYTPENETGLYSGHCSSAGDPTFNSVRRPSLSSYLGSGSLRSNSSTNSSHSFAFPILPTEWNGSPERMAKADPLRTRRRQLWRLCFFPCCNF